jgi:hypothetical protein
VTSGAVAKPYSSAPRRGDGDIPAGLQLAVCLEDDAAAQVVEEKNLVGLGEAELPWSTRIVDRGSRRSPGSAVMAGDEDDIGMALGDPGGNGPDPDFRHQLHVDAGMPVGVLQVVDQFREVLN